MRLLCVCFERGCQSEKEGRKERRVNHLLEKELAEGRPLSYEKLAAAALNSSHTSVGLGLAISVFSLARCNGFISGPKILATKPK